VCVKICPSSTATIITAFITACARYIYISIYTYVLPRGSTYIYRRVLCSLNAHAESWTQRTSIPSALLQGAIPQAHRGRGLIAAIPLQNSLQNRTPSTSKAFSIGAGETVLLFYRQLHRHRHRHRHRHKHRHKHRHRHRRRHRRRHRHRYRHRHRCRHRQ